MFDLDELSFKQGGGCFFTLFGLPFFSFGLIFLIAILGGSMNQSGGGSAPFFVMIPFSLIFICIGGGIMFGRAGISINKREQTVKKWWGLLFIPLSTKTRATNEFQMVTITQEVRRSKNSSYTVYPVKLAGKGDPVQIEEPRHYDEARKTSERVAKFLDLGVKDSGRGETVMREAGTLDESLRDRYKRLGKTPAMPVQPANCKSVQSTERDQAVFDIPAPGFNPILLGLIGVGGVFMLIFLSSIYGSVFKGLFKDFGSALLPFLVVLALFTVVPLAAVLLPIFLAGRTRDRVCVSTRGIRLIRKTPLSQRTLEIPSDELEELLLAYPLQRNLQNAWSGVQVVSARSDRHVIEFGMGLSGEELAWLRDVIEYLVTAPE